MKHIYLISGLGADKRVYRYIDLGTYQCHYIEWIEPIKRESIADYTRRLLAQIRHDRPVILGVSFGGMIAMEIGKLIETEKIILVSSVKSREDIPWPYRIAGALRLHRLMARFLLRKGNALLFWLFGVRDRNEQLLLTEILKESNPRFTRWAIDNVLHWKNETSLENVVSIHGTRDRLLPMRGSTHVIKDGGHLMIVSKAREVSEVINRVMKE